MVPYRLEYPGPDRSEAIVNTLVFSGALRGRWSVAGGTLATTGADLGGARIVSTVTVAGVTTTAIDKTLAELGGDGAGAAIGGPFTCAGGILDLTRDVAGAGRVGWVFARVEGG